MQISVVTKNQPVNKKTQELIDYSDKLPIMVDSNGYVLLKKNHGTMRLWLQLVTCFHKKFVKEFTVTD